LHAPLAHPNAHVTTDEAYVHAPPAQLPGLAKLRSELASAQTAAGGWTQVTPLHGSPTHALAWQPLAHAMSVDG
jgi:hypothetical protein